MRGHGLMIKHHKLRVNPWLKIYRYDLAMGGLDKNNLLAALASFDVRFHLPLLM